MGRAPGFLTEFLVLEATNTSLVLFIGLGRGTGLRLARSLGGRVGDVNTEIETALHGLAEIETCADGEANADFFGQ